jgi:hypothetical protein
MTMRRLVTPQQRRRENRLIGTTLAFVALGPPIGMSTLFLLELSAEIIAGKKALGELIFAAIASIALMVFAPFLYFPYFFGAIPAGIAGALVAYISISNRFSWWLVFLIGLGVGCLWFGHKFLFVIWRDDPGLRVAFASRAAGDILTCLVPTILCTAIVRHYERKWCRSPQDAVERVHDH